MKKLNQLIVACTMAGAFLGTSAMADPSKDSGLIPVVQCQDLRDLQEGGYSVEIQKRKNPAQVVAVVYESTLTGTRQLGRYLVKVSNRGSKNIYKNSRGRPFSLVIDLESVTLHTKSHATLDTCLKDGSKISIEMGCEHIVQI